MSEGKSSIWVASDVAYEGQYTMAIHFDDDHTLPLDTERAYAYASTVLAACERADHDAAIAAQMSRKLKMPMNLVGEMVSELRASRAPLNDAATAPLRVVPWVSGKTGKPFLALFIGAKQVGELDLAGARQHAIHVLSGIEAIPLDSAYRSYLVDKAGIEPERALNVVGDLINFRHQ